MFFFEELIQPPAMHVIDIGAMFIGEDPFHRLSEMGALAITGFEPLASECEKLNAQGKRGRRYLPYAIGDGERSTFYATNTGFTSSLLEPDSEFASRFRGLAEYMEVTSVSSIDTVRLDDVAELRSHHCDLLKLDTQGAELRILENAEKVLDGCVLVQTEVEFVALYKEQPLFAEIDQLLRKHGFMFHRFLNISGRTYKPLMMNNDPHATLSQQLWSDAVYTPDLRRLGRLEPQSLVKLAALLHEIYGSYDLCHVVLSEYDAKCGASLANRYIELLRQEQAPRPAG